MVRSAPEPRQAARERTSAQGCWAGRCTSRSQRGRRSPNAAAASRRRAQAEDSASALSAPASGEPGADDFAAPQSTQDLTVFVRACPQSSIA